MIAIAMMFVRDSGRRIIQKNCIGRAPSTRAASQSSSGTGEEELPEQEGRGRRGDQRAGSEPG